MIVNARKILRILSLINICIYFIIGLGELCIPLLKKLDRRGKPPIGEYFKEGVADTITLEFMGSYLEACKDIRSQKGLKETYEMRMFFLGYEAPKTVTKSKAEAERSVRENEERCLNFEKEAAAYFAGDFPCLFDRYGHVSDEKGEGEIKNLYNHAERSFYLEADPKLRYWLSGQERIVNRDGLTIGVRGIDRRTVDQLLEMTEGKPYEISELIVPNTDEDILCNMTLTGLLMFCDIRNCKFKINNSSKTRKCYFEFSDTPGYTGAEMCQKIKDLAESRGYKFKIIEK